MHAPLHRTALFGDASGIPQLLRYVPHNRICAIIGAAIRPNSHDTLREAAARINVPFLIQPRARDEAEYRTFLTQLAATQPDSLIAHSYAMLVQADIRALAGNRAFNIHAALLPKNRGPNPIQWALIHGDAETGVTLHVMEDGFDTGDILAQEPTPIHDADTWLTLSARMPALTDALLERTLPTLLEGRWSSRPQDASLARANPRITPASLPIDFPTMTDTQIYNLIRAQIAPLSGAYIDSAQGRLHVPTLLRLPEIPALRVRHA